MAREAREPVKMGVIAAALAAAIAMIAWLVWPQSDNRSSNTGRAPTYVAVRRCLERHHATVQALRVPASEGPSAPARELRVRIGHDTFGFLGFYRTRELAARGARTALGNLRPRGGVTRTGRLAAAYVGPRSDVIRDCAATSGA